MQEANNPADPPCRHDHREPLGRDGYYCQDCHRVIPWPPFVLPPKDDRRPEN